MIYLVIAIAANTVATLIWAVIRKVRGKDAGMAILFFLTPVLGFLMYYIPLLLYRINRATGYDREPLVGRIDVGKTIEKLDVESAYDVVPVQDALLQGSNKEKRRLLLNRMKGGIDASYSTIKQAETDSDSESVHYASAAKMELYSRAYRLVAQSQKAWKRNPEDPAVRRGFLESLSRFIESDFLQTTEKNLYMKEFCQAYDREDRREDTVAYNQFLRYACALDRQDLIDLELAGEDFSLWDYDTYKTLLARFYSRGEKPMFYRIMEMLKHSNLVLDHEGIELIRYWQAGGDDHAVD